MENERSILISVTKKLRPHWSNRREGDHVAHAKISVTKKLRPHWSSISSDIGISGPANFRNEKVTAPLKYWHAGPRRGDSEHFRNEKVTAPLKSWEECTDDTGKGIISVTKKLRPHWSSLSSCLYLLSYLISVTKKLRPHWSTLWYFPCITRFWLFP